MDKQILRVELTYNIKQLKKYVDEAIEKGAERISFDIGGDNKYLIFYTDFTPEQQNEYEIKELKDVFEKKLKMLENRKFKTHTFRTKREGLCESNLDKLVEVFKTKNNIKESLPKEVKQVINDDYDDFDEEMQTVFITELLDA